MKRGFTIVEVIVVVGLIAVILAIAIATYDAYQKRSYDAQAKGLASAVKSGVEQYFEANNEYALASVLFGGTPTGSVPSSYSAASTALEVPTSNLNSDKVKFIPCDINACTTNDVTKVYYLTKPSNVSTQYTYVINSCTYTLPSPEVGALSYFISFYSYDEDKWLVARSNRGSETTSNLTTCPFTTL